MNRAIVKRYWCSARLVISVLCVLCAPNLNSLKAQNWAKLIQLQGTNGSSAFFFNARAGLIGTGNYQSNIPAQIYHTEDGGTTWRLSQLQNPDIHGQVSDIFFRDRMNGWATIIEYSETGWSGVYHSTDGGLTWKRMAQAGFPVGVRETSRGTFYTDRDVNPGVKFSSDLGMTWTEVATTLTALGIDFMDDKNGFVTTQASDTSGLYPHLMTADSGLTWRTIESQSEAWTPYGDPIAESFFLASERDRLTFSTETAVIKVPIATDIENKIKTYGDSGLSGGVAGSHICNSIIYVQGREPATTAPGGIIRTEDGGSNWVFVGGPNTIYDKRFAVTGRGAVVFAFDDSGGVWLTTDGGDGTLSPSVLPDVSLSWQTPLPASPCDSESIPIVLGYSLCDSVRILNVTILNDSETEIGLNGQYNTFFTSSRSDTLHIVYRPKRIENFTLKVSLTIEQPDGYTEDTTIAIPLSSVVSKIGALQIITNQTNATSTRDTVFFDSVSTCVDASLPVTLANFGCVNLNIDSIASSGNNFDLVSSYNPFVLSPGDSRAFLIRYTPNAVEPDRGVLYVHHDGILDSVILLGIGYSSGNSVSLTPNGSILAPLCDSSQFSITLRNIACKPFLIDSIATDTPFHVMPLASTDSLQPGTEANLGFVFAPSEHGQDTGQIHLFISYSGNGSYDTTFRIIGIGSAGKPAFTVSRNSVQLGNVGVCSQISDTLLISSHGCSPVTVTASFDTMNGFSLLNAPKSPLAPGDSDIITINYLPNHTLGLYSTNLILTTSAGVDTIPISVNVTSDPGSVTINSTQNISEFVCRADTFSISFANGLCDSISVDSIKLSGTNAEDFSISDTLPFSIGSQNSKSIIGIFAPQDSLTRSANATLTIHKSDGTSFDTTISILAQGIGVPPIQVALGGTSFAAEAGGQISIPIVAKRGSETDMNTLDFQLILNSDLITPASINSNGFFANASKQNITFNQAKDGTLGDTAVIHLQLPSDAILPSGTLCEVVCNAYVTKTLSTNILLENVTFHDASGSSQCLTSATVPDTTAIFTLDRECGDTTLAYAIGYNSIIIDGVAPNPTSGKVNIQFALPPDYANDAVLEIYDVLGEKLRELPIQFPSGTSGKQTMDVDLTQGLPVASERILYLRLRMRAGMAQTFPISIVLR